MAVITGATSAAAVVTPAPGGHWLKDPQDPARTIPLFVTDGPNITETRRQTEHQPLGSSAAVVVKDASPGNLTIGLKLYLPNDAARVAVLKRKHEGRTLLYQDSVGHQYYVQFRADVGYRPASYAVVDQEMDIAFIKVAKP